MTEHTTALVTKLEAAERALSQAKTLPVVINLRDQAETLRYLAKKAKLSLKFQNEIAVFALAGKGKRFSIGSLAGLQRPSPSSFFLFFSFHFIEPVSALPP